MISAELRPELCRYRIDEYEGDLDSVKSIVGYNSQSAKIAERFAWLMISAVVGVAAYSLKI